MAFCKEALMKHILSSGKFFSILGVVLISTLVVSSCNLFGTKKPTPLVESGLPDLAVTISGPAQARQGEEIAEKLSIEIKNMGTATARGTIASSGAVQEGGFMIDFVLSTDEEVQVEYALYDEVFSEDVLLKGGRVSNTSDLPPMTTISYQDSTTSLPEQTPPGDYFLCALIDPGEKVEESNESNNIDCFPIKIVL